MNVLSKQDECILKAFLETNIPLYVRENSIDDWDLMECYEELFNYSHSLLQGYQIDFEINSTETGKAFIFDQNYSNVILELAKSNCGFDTKIHCYMSLAALLVLKKKKDMEK